MTSLYKRAAQQAEIFFERKPSFFIRSSIELYLRIPVHHNFNRDVQFELSVVDLHVALLTRGEGS
jgi:hypothetical protein